MTHLKSYIINTQKNKYSEKEKNIMPKSINKPKDHSIDNGMSLFSLNLTNKSEIGLRNAMLKT